MVGDKKNPCVLSTSYMGAPYGWEDEACSAGAGVSEGGARFSSGNIPLPRARSRCGRSVGQSVGLSVSAASAFRTTTHGHRRLVSTFPPFVRPSVALGLAAASLRPAPSLPSIFHPSRGHPSARRPSVRPCVQRGVIFDAHCTVHRKRQIC